MPKTPDYGIDDEVLRMVIQELLIVAKGASVSRLRTLVQDAMPQEKFPADRFMAIVKRIKLATEAMEGSAMEAYQMAMQRLEQQ